MTSSRLSVRQIPERYLLHLTICLILATPLLWFRDLPLFDLPAHVAREHILFDPDLAPAGQFYVPDWKLVPNLAIDGFVYLAHFLLPIDVSIRLFLVVTALQFYLGAAFLNATLFQTDRRFSLWAALFVFNGPFLLGFVNSCFGVGMALWVFALWLRLRDRPSSLVTFAMLASLILLAHVFAFAIYALVVVACVSAEAGKAVLAAGRLSLARTPRALAGLAKGVAHLVPPALLYLEMTAHGVHGGITDPATVKSKVAGLFGTAGIYAIEFDFFCLLAFLICFILVRRQLVLARTMAGPIVALLAAFILLPHALVGATSVDYRVPAISILFVAGATGWCGTLRARRFASAAIVVALIFRTGAMMAQWATWQPVYAEYRQAFAHLPMGARLLALGTKPNMVDGNEHPPIAHVDALAVVERSAFVPTLFADVPSSILRYAPGVARIAAEFPDASDLRDYDYLLVIHPDLNPVPPGVEEVTRGRSFVLARILH